MWSIVGSLIGLSLAPFVVAAVVATDHEANRSYAQTYWQTVRFLYSGAGIGR